MDRNLNSIDLFLGLDALAQIIPIGGADYDEINRWHDFYPNWLPY